MKYLFLLLMGIFCSCKNTEKERINFLIDKWNNQEIVYPLGLHFTTLGKDTNYLPKSEYTIVSYVDSVGCTSCKLQLNQWRRLINQLDSVGNTSILFFLHPKSKKELDYVLKKDNFTHPVCIDEEDAFNKLNHFPEEMAFQTFLLDSNNKVVAIGNPIHNHKVKELYLKIILGDKFTKEEVGTRTTVVCSSTILDLGKFNWHQGQKGTFILKNTGDSPLAITDVITSCGCTTVDYRKEPVRPGGSVGLTVQYKADHPEHFDKTITVYCNVEASPVKLRVRGYAE